MKFLVAGLVAALAAPACFAEDGGLAAPPVAHGRQAADETHASCAGSEPTKCSNGLVPLCNQDQWYCGSPGDTVLPGVTCPPGLVKDPGKGCFPGNSDFGREHGHDHDGFSGKQPGAGPPAHHGDADGSDDDKDDAPKAGPPAAGQLGGAAAPAHHHDDPDDDKHGNGTPPSH